MTAIEDLLLFQQRQQEDLEREAEQQSIFAAQTASLRRGIIADRPGFGGLVNVGEARQELTDVRLAARMETRRRQQANREQAARIGTTDPDSPVPVPGIRPTPEFEAEFGEPALVGDRLLGGEFVTGVVGAEKGGEFGDAVGEAILTEGIVGAEGGAIDGEIQEDVIAGVDVDPTLATFDAAIAAEREAIVAARMAQTGEEFAVADDIVEVERALEDVPTPSGFDAEEVSALEALLADLNAIAEARGGRAADREDLNELLAEIEARLEAARGRAPAPAPTGGDEAGGGDL